MRYLSRLLFVLLFVQANAFAENRNFYQVEDTLHQNNDGGVPALAVRQSSIANSAVSADGVYASVKVDDDGRLYVNADGASPDKFFTSTSGSDITTTTSTQVAAGGGAGIRHYVRTWTVSNMHATVGTRVDLLDGSTVIWHCPAAAGGGGCTVNFPTALRGSVNTALNCQAATTGAQVRCSIDYYNSAN